MKFFPALVLVFLSLHSFAQQTPGTLLESVNSVADAEKLIQSNPKLEGRIFSLNSGADSSEIAVPLYRQKPGFVFEIGEYVYKIIGLDSALASRVSYIYFDGGKLSILEINPLRKQVIAKYKAGAAFDELAAEYAMDGNRTGDLGWFTTGLMVPEFEAAVKAHKKNDIFTLDIPARNWYYVVLKTFDEAFVKTLTLVKVKNDH